MSDFLHQLRNGNDKRYNKKRSQYDRNNNVVYDRRNNREHRRNTQKDQGSQDQSVGISVETLSAIKDLLENIVENQERQIVTETRKADALENIAAFLNKSPGSLVKKTEAVHEEIESSTQKRKRSSKKKDDPNRKKVMQIIEKMRKKNATYHEIAQELERENLQTFSGRGKWHAQTIHRLCQG